MCNTPHRITWRDFTDIYTYTSRTAISLSTRLKRTKHTRATISRIHSYHQYIHLSFGLTDSHPPDYSLQLYNIVRWLHKKMMMIVPAFPPHSNPKHSRTEHILCTNNTDMSIKHKLLYQNIGTRFSLWNCSNGISFK